jgi:sigma-B regulation protein RsbU (phosphoserine phosphatase)
MRKGAGRERLKVGGTVLGTFADAVYNESSGTVNPGDTLIIYSDGITDSVNSDGEEFGEARLSRVAAEHLDKSAAQMIDAIMDSVGLHTAGEAQLDDMTLVVIKRME